MKLIPFIFLFLILSQYSFSQDNCPEYDRLMEEAATFMKKSDYRNALYKYNSAKTCSPSRRKEVDEKINQLFERIETERIKAVINEKEIRNKKEDIEKMSKSLLKTRDSLNKERVKDSTNFAENFISKNKTLFDTVLSDSEKKQLLHHIESLRLAGSGNEASSLASSLLLHYNAKKNSDQFFELYQEDQKFNADPDFFKRRSAISHIGYITFDTYYYWALEKNSQAKNLLPESSRSIYESKINTDSIVLRSRREQFEKSYWMADTVIDLYDKDSVVTIPCADNQNFIWGYFTTSFEDYKKRQLRFRNISVKDFSFTTDSLIRLSPKGKFYSVLAADADYRYTIVKEVEYSLKKNLFDFETKPGSELLFTDTEPLLIKLIDKNGRLLEDFSAYSNTAYFFSPDANFIATWQTHDNSFELILYNLKTKSFWKIPNTHFANTMSFSSDSKTMIYYNDSTRLFYFLDLTGKKPEITMNFSPGIPDIQNIDFTGNSSFLKINTPEKILLYDIVKKKILFQFDNAFVKNIIVAPNKKDLLITCNRVAGKNNSGFLTYRVDMDLNMKDKLYSDCENYFYTPDGKYIVAYDRWNIMRWNTDKSLTVKNEFRSCMGFTELLWKNGIPYNYFQTISDAVQIEKGARQFYNNWDNQKGDSVLNNLYLKQSQLLFDRLKINDAQNIDRDRVPFFYDWSNHIRRLLGDRDFYQQFSSQQAAIVIFDNLLNSPDSVYPLLLNYAANGNKLLRDLYDSLGSYTPAYIDQIKKEILLREKVFAKAPDDQNDYNSNASRWMDALQKLSTAIEIVGRHYLSNKQYLAKLSLNKTEEEYLARGLKALSSPFYLESLYINALTQLATGYLYIYANNPTENAIVLDSAILYADKGLSLSPGDFDQANFLTVKANAYLLQHNGLTKALETYEKILRDFPEFRKSTINQQLQALKNAGADEAKISKAEEFIKKY